MFIPSLSVSNSTQGPGGSSYLFFLVIIAFIAVRRISRGVRGSPFRISRVLRAPIIYSILSVLFIFVLSPLNYDIYATIIFLPVGLLFGLGVGGSISFFLKGNVVFYKRSQAILVFWIVSFMLRIILEMFYSNIVIAEIVFDALLAFTSGLIIGEAINIINKAKVYSAENLASRHDN